MRVLIIHSAGNPSLPSGERVVLEDDERGLRAAGVCTRVEVAAHSPTTMVGMLGAVGGLFWSRNWFQRTQELVREFRPDVLHAHGVLPTLSASIFHAAKRLGVATIQTLHNYRWFCAEGGLFRDGGYCDACIGHLGARGVVEACARGSRSLSLALVVNNTLHVKTRLLQHAVDRFVAVSDYVRARHIEAGFGIRHVVVRRNTVSLPPVREGLPANSVCFVGRLDRGKGADLLIPLARSLSDHRFEIVGTGDLEGLLHKELSGLGSVVLRGRVSRSEVSAAMGRARVVLVPSRMAEPFGLVAAEAMAAGIPVVASNRGALPELVEASEGGLVAEPSVESLAAAIRRISASDSLALRLGVAGRQFARTELSPATGARRLIEIYRGAIDSRDFHRRSSGGQRKEEPCGSSGIE